MGPYVLLAAGSGLIALGSTTLGFPIMWIAAPLFVLPGIGCVVAALRQGCAGSLAVGAILLFSVYCGGWVANVTGTSILYNRREVFSREHNLAPPKMPPPAVPWGKSYLLLIVPTFLAVIAAAPDEKRSGRCDPKWGIGVWVLSFAVYPLTAFLVWLVSHGWGLSA